MANQSSKVEALRSKIENYLRQKQISYEVRADGRYAVRQGSTVVLVAPAEWNEQTIVRVFAPVSLNITRITPELTLFLVEENNNLTFGRFSLDTENKIVWFEHALLGDFMDVEELFIAVAAVAYTADKYDEQVSGMAGGKRAADL
ncbi:MAG: YbjN domain-containing protein [Candidatus Bathyarchaeia archaeon]